MHVRFIACLLMFCLFAACDERKIVANEEVPQLKIGDTSYIEGATIKISIGKERNIFGELSYPIMGGYISVPLTTDQLKSMAKQLIEIEKRRR